MHQHQDIHDMGGLRECMPIGLITWLVGSLALIGTPFFSGFYSKDSIIEAVHASHLYGAGFAYFAVAAGVFVTAFYSFRMYFLVFHGPERFRRAVPPPEAQDDHAAHDDDHGADAHISHSEPDAHAHDPHAPPHESPGVVDLAADPARDPVGADRLLRAGSGRCCSATSRARSPSTTRPIRQWKSFAGEWHGPMAMVTHSLSGPVLWLAVAGVVVAWFLYLRAPRRPSCDPAPLPSSTVCSTNKYWFDWFNERILRVPLYSSARRLAARRRRRDQRHGHRRQRQCHQPPSACRPGRCRAAISTGTRW